MDINPWYVAGGVLVFLFLTRKRRNCDCTATTPVRSNVVPLTIVREAAYDPVPVDEETAPETLPDSTPLVCE